MSLVTSKDRSRGGGGGGIWSVCRACSVMDVIQGGGVMGERGERAVCDRTGCYVLYPLS